MNCVKRKYKTEIDAELALEYLKDVRKIHRREKHPIRHYYCHHCSNYHLTSQPANQEEITLVHTLKFQEFLGKQKIEQGKQKIEQEIEKMFATHNKPEKLGYKRKAWKIKNLKNAAA